MGNYGITALSGLPMALDRQDQRNDRQDQRDWNEEYRGQQRRQWDRSNNDYEAGAENRNLALQNEKKRLLMEQAKLEQARVIKKVWPALQVIDKEDGDKDEYGKAMSQILSAVNAKEIEYAPEPFTGRGPNHKGFQFKSKDGHTYSFKDFQNARDNIGAIFDPEKFLQLRWEALNEEGLYVTPNGKIVQKKRGEAEREGLTPYALVKAQGEMAAIGRKNLGKYKTVETDQGIIAYNEQDPGQRMALGNAPVSEADRAAGASANVKITKQFKDDLAFVLTPFAKPGMDMTALFNGGELTEPAKNALESAISFYERNSNVPNLPPQDKMKLQKAKDAIRLYNHMSQTVRNRYDLGEDADTATPTALGLLKGSSPKGLSSENTPQGEQGYQGPKYVDGEDAQAMDNQPPIAGAKQAPDGNWYVPDPNRPGKYMRVFMGGMR